MTTYKVFYSVGQNTATIALDDYEPTDGGVEVGTFDLNVDPINAQTSGSVLATTQPDDSGISGDHIFIRKAREVLANSDDFKGNVRNVIFMDKASNAPVHAEIMEQDDSAEEGSDPDISNQRGGEGSTENTDPATTEANGVDQKGERAEGEGSQDDQQDGEQEDTGSETVAQLKERVAGINDKAELEKVYTEEQGGKNRPTAIAAIEARAAELNAA